MSDLIIRQVDVEDLPEVIRIENSSFDYPWPPICLLSELLPSDTKLSLVAELDGKIVGYLMSWFIVDEAHIVNVAIDSSFRRNGAASAFLDVLMEKGKKVGVKTMTLEVRRSNCGAIDFYKQHSFKQVGVRKGYYQDSKEDALIMTRAIDE